MISTLIVPGDGIMSVADSYLSNGSSLAAESGTSTRHYRHIGSVGLRRVAVALAVSGCSHSPTMDLLGSYFPAWILCSIVGIVAAVVIRQILAVIGISDYVVAPLLTYAGLALSATLLFWLVWFGH
jgi:hypothetical protein